MESGNRNLQFVPFSSAVSSTFWESFSKLKLNELCLSTDPVDISGIYSRWIVEGVAPLFHLQHDSLNETRVQPGEILASGTLINTNTIDDFKKRDKSELLEIVASEIWDAIISGEAENSPLILSSFLVYIYADLKKYHYYYWFAFPAFLYPRSIELVSQPQTLEERISDDQLVQDIHSSIRNTNVNLSFFTLIIEEGKSNILPLSSYYKCLKERRKKCDIWLGFSDPSNSPSHPSWILRNVLTLAAVRWSDIKSHTVIAFREKVSSQSSSIGESLILEVTINDKELAVKEMPSALGWEKNDRGKMGPRFSNMIKTMDPSRIAESAVELNLRLMKWRLDPILDLDVIKNCRCLLIGAGTLGCNVARCLMGWGVQKITLVDSGRVSYSNPVRQSLYVFEDCLQEGKMKAEVAAKALQQIFPRVDARGIALSVPMPGHSVGSSEYQRIANDVATLERLVDDHEVIFLLTDSRESRWLPSLIGAAKKKIVLTAALGFDSYLVMQHGILADGGGQNAENTLGCYFCNDVVAPGDSTSDRTLDQQCTVTRPGVSYMAAGHIVEMLIEILQNPIRSKSGEGDVVVPHSIRYYLGRMDQLVTSSPAFKNCSACSALVVSAYREKGIKFLVKVFNSPSYLEDVSGLTKLHQESQTMELLEVSDSEEEVE